jgi:hypothetical protein
MKARRLPADAEDQRDVARTLHIAFKEAESLCATLARWDCLTDHYLRAHALRQLIEHDRRTFAAPEKVRS